jgi:glycosyltransferase involved in cell wall biosynthesis
MVARKIAFFLPDLSGGGAERVAVNLANNSSARGFVVELVLTVAVGELLADLHPELTVRSLSVSRLRGALLPLTRYLKMAEPEVLLVYMWPLIAISVLARAGARVDCRLVLTEHTTWSHSELSRGRLAAKLIRSSMKLAFPRADAIVTVSKGAADDLANFAGIQRHAINVILNPVVDDPMVPGVSLPANPAEWWNGTHKRVIAVGSLKPVKDYSLLLNAFRGLCDRVDARLLILGDGQCRRALENQLEELGLRCQVFMPGFINNPRQYFGRADLHVLSSRAEGFGNVIVEALAEGTPVVSVDCPYGPREILCDGEFGRLVPVGDSEALSVAMFEELQRNHDPEPLRTRAREFSISRIADQYLDVMFPGWRER